MINTYLLSLLTCGAGQRALEILQKEESSVLGEILGRLGGAHEWAAGGRYQGQSLMRVREYRVHRGHRSWILSSIFLPCYHLPLLFPIQWYTGIQISVEFILPGKGCRGTAGFWYSKRHTTGGGMERPGGSQCPGAQAPGGTGVQGKGKASRGRLSSTGPWEFSCKGRRHRLEVQSW